MSRGILSKMIEEIGETQAEVRAEDYTMVNVRPGEKVASMLDLVSALSGKTPSAVVAEEIDKALASGMNGYLTKPVNKTELHAVLTKYLGGEMSTESSCIAKGGYTE